MSDLNLKIIKDYVDKKVAGALTGKSAYQVAVDNGFVGTEQEWLVSLKSVLTEQDKENIADIVLGELPTTEGVQYGNTNN